MTRDKSFLLMAAAGTAAALMAGIGCGGKETTASKGAAAYDEAQRRGTPVGGGEGPTHGGHAAGREASPAAGPAREGMSSSSGHEEPGKTPGDVAATNAMPGRGVKAQPGAHGAAAHERQETGPRPPDHASMAGMRHPAPAATAGRSGGRPAEAHHAGTPAPSAPSAPSAHAAHQGGAAQAVPMAPSIPEPPAAVAQPGQPAATLRPDDLDAPPATAVREAARAAEMAAGGHAMSHGTYRQVDAGRDEVVPDSPVGEERVSIVAPSPTPDPHAMHAAPPSPRPKPSPETKEQR